MREKQFNELMDQINRASEYIGELRALVDLLITNRDALLEAIEKELGYKAKNTEDHGWMFFPKNERISN